MRTIESMSTVTDQFTEFTTRTQDAVTGAARTWADTLRSVTSGRPEVPDAHVVVERCFGLAQQVLDHQRAFATTLLDAGSKAAETVTEQAARAAESVTAQAVNVTETVLDKADHVTTAPSERSARTAATN